MSLKQGDLVTVMLENDKVSNTYIFQRLVGEDLRAQLSHPLYPGILIEKDIRLLNKVGPQLKDSIERSLDYAMTFKTYLDYNSVADLESLCMYHIVTKKLTPRQKRVLSGLCGSIAAIKLNNEIKDAMEIIVENEGVLDEFNRMWYNNFSGLFKGNQQITSKKQRGSIFNIAGFVLSQLHTPSIIKSKVI